MIYIELLPLLKKRGTLGPLDDLDDVSLVKLLVLDQFLPLLALVASVYHRLDRELLIVEAESPQHGLESEVYVRVRCLDVLHQVDHCDGMLLQDLGQEEPDAHGPLSLGKLELGELQSLVVEPRVSVHEVDQ